MKKFTKNPEISRVFLPGMGEIHEGQILTGDGYEKYAEPRENMPRFLVEVLPETGRPLEDVQSVQSGSQLMEPRPSAPQRLDESAPMKRPRGRPRKNPPIPSFSTSPATPVQALEESSKEVPYGTIGLDVHPKDDEPGDF